MSEVEPLGTSFNSLSRDHGLSRLLTFTGIMKVTFQLPLSGSQIAKTFRGAASGAFLLSTPSLGITIYIRLLR